MLISTIIFVMRKVYTDASCHTKGCDSLSLSKGRYDETFVGEDDTDVGWYK